MRGSRKTKQRKLSLSCSDFWYTFLPLRVLFRHSLSCTSRAVVARMFEKWPSTGTLKWAIWVEFGSGSRCTHMYASNLHKMPAPSHLSAAPVVTQSPPGFRRLVPPAHRLPLLLTVCPSCSPFPPSAGLLQDFDTSFQTWTLERDRGGGDRLCSG